jgi:aspartyl-tRNA(Asn)/glutamyl-tRNA(Gln) amidotransferase subunit B
MANEYKTTIGLEIHAELKTATKMFCDSRNDTDEKRPNVNVCPICMAHPGTLPTINKQAVKHILKIGIAVDGRIADFTEFDRKNYFYPDIPKGYQISQYQYPLISGGSLNGIRLTRIHLEEDTAKSTHDQHEDSLIDFNRAGIPLMELVTEPEIESASEAAAFAKELQLILRCLGASDANMEKGEMRVEANVSVVSQKSKVKSQKLGTKVEVKNLNSFKSVERAIDYEVDRQIAILESGGKVVQETRGWDEVVGKTFSQRLKEESHDYRYFPEPDLPKLFISRISEFSKDRLFSELPELPRQRRERYQKDFGLKLVDAEQLVNNISIANFFDEVISRISEASSKILAANYLLSDIVGLAKKAGGNQALEEGLAKMTVSGFVRTIDMIALGDLSSRGAKDILIDLFSSGGDPDKIAKAKGLLQSHDLEELTKIVETVIRNQAGAVSEYRAGKTAALQFLVGQAMKESRGRANPKILADLFISDVEREKRKGSDFSTSEPRS